MSEKRFHQFGLWVIDNPNFNGISIADLVDTELMPITEVVGLLNEQQELIEELQVSDEMGWKRAEHFEKKCPKELHNKKMYIKRLEYKVQKFKEENEQLRQSISKTILDFCNWLGGQGLAYETIYYGEEKDIERLINKYLETKGELNE